MSHLSYFFVLLYQWKFIAEQYSKGWFTISQRRQRQEKEKGEEEEEKEIS